MVHTNVSSCEMLGNCWHLHSLIGLAHELGLSCAGLPYHFNFHCLTGHFCTCPLLCQCSPLDCTVLVNKPKVWKMSFETGEKPAFRTLLTSSRKEKMFLYTFSGSICPILHLSCNSWFCTLDVHFGSHSDRLIIDLGQVIGNCFCEALIHSLPPLPCCQGVTDTDM